MGPFGIGYDDLDGEPQPAKTREPLVGWRLWRLRGARLHACVLDYTWRQGANRATCLLPKSCPSAPGRNCRCGFWATSSIGDTMLRAMSDRTERAWVVGLVRGWGEVAVHGQEGFRAEWASVLCLFVDWPWGQEAAKRLPSWRSWILEVGGVLNVRPDPDRMARLRSAAGAYAVPLLGVRDALEAGILAEFGLGAASLAEVGQEVRMP